VFVGIGAQAVAYNLFLDGSLFHDTPRVSKRVGVAELQVGVAGTLNDLTLRLLPEAVRLRLNSVRFGLTLIRRSREFDGAAGKVEEFWSFSLTAACRQQPAVFCI